jgi:hypothetical protein
MAGTLDKIKKELTSFYKRESEKFIYWPIDSDHVIGMNLDKEPMKANEDYFRLWLKEMYLTHNRNFFTDRFPVVHSLVKFQFGNNELNISNIAGSLNIEKLDRRKLENTIQLSHKLTTLVPFKGGEVDIDAGLLAVKGENYLNSFIKTMGDFATMLTQPQLSLVLNIAEKLTVGIQDLFNAIEADLHLGMHQTYAAQIGAGKNLLKAQYIAVIKAKENDEFLEKLWIKNDRLYYGEQNDNKPFTSYDYMLFFIEKCKERDDWNSLKTIYEPYQKACNSLLWDEKTAQVYIKTAKTAALTSDDLTMIDRTRVATRIEEMFYNMSKSLVNKSAETPNATDQGMRDTGARDEKFSDSTLRTFEPPDLDQIMKNAMSIEEARKRIWELKDAKGNDLGVFLGKSSREAALDAARMGFNDIRLQGYSSNQVHMFKGERSLASKSKGTSARVPDLTWKPQVKKVGMIQLEELQTFDKGNPLVEKKVKPVARGKSLHQSKGIGSKSIEKASKHG